MRKLVDVLKTNEEKIVLFESSLLFIIHTKINEIRELKNIK